MRGSPVRLLTHEHLNSSSAYIRDDRPLSSRNRIFKNRKVVRLLESTPKKLKIETLNDPNLYRSRTPDASFNHSDDKKIRDNPVIKKMPIYVHDTKTD